MFQFPTNKIHIKIEKMESNTFREPHCFVSVINQTNCVFALRSEEDLPACRCRCLKITADSLFTAHVLIFLLS